MKVSVLSFTFFALFIAAPVAFGGYIRESRFGDVDSGMLKSSEKVDTVTTFDIFEIDT